MRRTYERGTKARLCFSGRPHAPVNMADSMEEVNVGEKKSQICCAALRYISYAKFSQNLEVLWDFHRLFGSRNSPTTGILHTIRHVYRACGPPEKLSLALVPRCAWAWNAYSGYSRMLGVQGTSLFLCNIYWLQGTLCVDRSASCFLVEVAV